MSQDLHAFWRLSRPVFLLGGVVLYALGAGIAHAQGKSSSLTVYALGQLYVSSLQLMTHYLNEYWDVDADRLNQSRTAFSGGSGVLPSGELSPQTALTGAASSLACSAILAIGLAVQGRITPVTGSLMLGMLLGAYFYSSPPLRLASTGVGEVLAALIVAAMVPWLGLVVAGGRPSAAFFAAIAPIVLIQFAMLLAFEFPDELSDRQAGKRTLLVRIGSDHGVLVHNIGLFAGVLLIVVGSRTVLPYLSAFIAIATTPVALGQMVAVAVVGEARCVRFETVTFLAIATFSLTATLFAIVFWTA
jgi:1,4-dihydroxy-2-naphthoate octaprenyltransferase